MPDADQLWMMEPFLLTRPLLRFALELELAWARLAVLAPAAAGALAALFKEVREPWEWMLEGG